MSEKKSFRFRQYFVAYVDVLAYAECQERAEDSVDMLVEEPIRAMLTGPVEFDELRIPMRFGEVVNPDDEVGTLGMNGLDFVMFDIPH
jgi:hypothetical protein